jgi:putative membrane protein
MADDAGVVTLNGRVHSRSEPREAGDAAWATFGVTNVVNDLHIENCQPCARIVTSRNDDRPARGGRDIAQGRYLIRNEENTMMYGYDSGMSGWGYALMTVAVLLVAGLVATGTLVLIRSGTAARRSPTDVMRQTEAERILEQRFAAGEVDQDEFRSRMDVLRSAAKP